MVTETRGPVKRTLSGNNNGDQSQLFFIQHLVGHSNRHRACQLTWATPCPSPSTQHECYSMAPNAKHRAMSLRATAASYPGT